MPGKNLMNIVMGSKEEPEIQTPVSQESPDYLMTKVYNPTNNPSNNTKTQGTNQDTTATATANEGKNKGVKNKSQFYQQPNN